MILMGFEQARTERAALREIIHSAWDGFEIDTALDIVLDFFDVLEMVL